MNAFWKATNDGTQFNLFSIGHIISLSVIIGIIILGLLFANKVHPILIIMISGALGIIFYGFIPL